MVPDTVAAFRERYRREKLPARYSGRAHFAFITTLALGVTALCLWRSAGATPREWLAVPVTFLFANFVEYRGHRGPMHHRTRGLGLLYQRHTLSHHRYYTDEAMAAASARDFHMVLFPPVLLLFFLGQLVPLFFVVKWIWSAAVGWLFCATGVAYYLTYEWLHLAYHLPRESFVGRLRVVAALRRLHTEHHAPALMQRWNFNITFPICDALFGTRYRGEAGAPGDQAP